MSIAPDRMGKSSSRWYAEAFEPNILMFRRSGKEKSRAGLKIRLETSALLANSE